ncbi:hypothetical protein [Leptolyngbya sp. 7M]|uniref:hypothetical protein n=1 Tax=Leptolyngbya sp. 7M TaxID=2812896 RepID=UPI001B8D1C90|nr:hypothetical protein [Leptolyngbya sp. 7M]QYO62487.1 hypothetical protein JVX88_20695 [Leptolyngbya sp. 7M]
MLGAYFRQGLHELGSVFYGAGTAAQHPEYGMIGTKTPGQVADGLRGNAEPERGRDEPGQSALDAYLAKSRERQATTPESERDRDTPELERE